MGKKLSQKDIAETLNLSRVTVTKALKDDTDIAKKTRELVKKKAEELGYIPNLVGRSLSSNKTNIIGLVLPKIAHSFFSHSVEYFYMAASKLGYNILPTISFEDGDNEIKNIKTLLSLGVDGIIVNPSSTMKDFSIYERVERSGVKLIFYDRIPVGFQHAGVTCNDFIAAEKMVGFMISKGYRKIAHFAGTTNLNIGKERLAGYVSALEKAGITIDNKLIQEVELTEKGGYEKFIEFFIKNGVPDAVFAVNDSVAIGIYRAAEKLNLKIPSDIAIAGFGDLNSARLVNPKLTTVRLPIDTMCESAVKNLVDLIEGRELTESDLNFEADLVIRNSV